MPLRSIKLQLSRVTTWLGCVLAGLAMSSCSRQDIGYLELVKLVAKNECATAEAVASSMLIVIRDGSSTSYIRYPNEAAGGLTDTSLVQFGALTSSFLVPRVLNRLTAHGLTLDSIALIAGGAVITGGRQITYGELLLHRSGLPPYRELGDMPPRQQLTEMMQALHRQLPSEADTSFHFDHWNYTLAVWSLAHREGSPSEAYRSSQLRYVDRADSTLRARLAPSEAPSPPVRAQSTELFVLSTGGVGDAHVLVELLDSLSTVDWDRLPAKPTMASRPAVSMTLGWFRQQVPNNQYVLTNAGRTRRHGAAVAYNPFTDTGVVVLIGDSKPADCLALDILRNINRDWKRSALVPLEDLR